MNYMNGNGNGQTHENSSPIVLAFFGCLLCLPIIYLATRPVAWAPHAQWVHWLLGPPFILLPISVAFIILYSSIWHREWPGPKRILSVILVSGMIFCVALLGIGLALTAGLFWSSLNEPTGTTWQAVTKIRP